MKTRIYTLLAALLLTFAGVQAQDKTATTISVDVVSSIVVGDDANVSVTLSAEINAIATLTVTSSDNSYNKTFNVGLVGGNGRYTVPNLAEGKYSVTASFAGNFKYDASTSDAQTLEVNKVPTTLTLSLDENEIVRTKEIYVGDFPFLKCTLDQSINGVFNLTVNGENHVEGFVNGKYTYERHTGASKVSWVPDYFCNFYNLPAGTYTYKATYAGNDKYEGSESDEVTLTVLKNPTTISVAEITPITEGQDAAITVNMTPSDTSAVATLTVGEKEYNVAVVNGTGTCYVPNLTAGTYDVTASFAGNFKYAASTTETAKTLTVNAGNPIVESNSVVTVTLDQEITKVATVTVGNATYYVPVVNGTGTLTLPQQVAGAYNVQAKFIEDEQYAAATSDEKQLVSVTGVTFPFATGQTWATWCDDWAWKKPTGVTAYTISAVIGNTVTITAVEGETIPSHTPLLLRKTTDAVTPTKVITGTEPTGYKGIVSTAATGATFWGNASDTKITEGYNYTYGNSYGLYNGEFVLIDTDNGIAANRCLLNVGGTNSAPVLTIGTEMTSLSPVPSPSREGSSQRWYTLDGRKLNGKPTQKGIYVNGGRKVVIK